MREKSWYEMRNLDYVERGAGVSYAIWTKRREKVYQESLSEMGYKGKPFEFKKTYSQKDSQSKSKLLTLLEGIKHVSGCKNCI